MRSVLDAVEHAAPQLKSLKAPIVKQIFCTVIRDGAVPLLALKSDTMQRVAQIGCDLVIDVLYIDPDEA